MCRSWRRAELAKQILLPHSEIDNLKVFHGGIIKYKEKFPNEIISEWVKFRIPIIQQVQIVTWFLIFIFSVLGLFLNTFFFAWAIVIWIWLTVAWFTGFCWLANLLWKLPFNK
jgi:hypothetical protein